VQSAGNVDFFDGMEMAGGTYGSGSYNISGGTLTVASLYENNTSQPGYNASVNQTGGSVYIGNLGMYGNSSYSLSNTAGPSLLYLYGDEDIDGSIGNSSFTQNGGTHTINGALVLATSTAYSASYTLSNGTLTAASEAINQNSSGGATFTQSGGTNTAIGDLSLGDGSTGTGHYSLNSGTLAVGGTLWLPGNQLDGGNALFIQAGGAVTTSSIGFGYYYGFGQYYMAAGSLATGSINFAPAGDSGGAFFQEGGSITVGTSANPGSISMEASVPDWSGAYNLSVSAGPSSLTLYGNLQMGGNGDTYAFNQSGGVATIYGNVSVADASANSVASITFSNSASFTTTGSMYVGGSSTAPEGQGTYQQTGGSVTVDGAFQVWNSAGTSASLSSGTLTVGSIETENAHAPFNWTGGTLDITNQYVYFSTNYYPAYPAQFGNTLTLNGSQALIVQSAEALVDSGSSVTQLFGSSNTCGSLFVGSSAGPSTEATYTLSGGNLICSGTETIGWIGMTGGAGGLGIFNQLGGVNTANSLYLGRTGPGTYTLYGGTLNAGSIYIDGANPNSLNVQGGTLTAAATTNNQTIQQTGGIASLGNVTGSGGLFVGNFAGPSASMSVASLSQSSVFINATGTLEILRNAAAPNSINSLTLQPGGRLDLTNNHLFINYGPGGDPFLLIRSYLASGYNLGAWNGSGIDSSTAAVTLGYGIGMADGADGVVAGLPSGRIELKYTLYGDINLDGSVNGTDFALLAAHFGTSDTGGWEQGDLNYNGVVNGSDFALLASNFGTSASGTAIQLPASEWAALDAFAAAHGLSADLPEPTSTTTLLLGAIILRRRGRPIELYKS
jgi:hypothetical protein